MFIFLQHISVYEAYQIQIVDHKVLLCALEYFKIVGNLCPARLLNYRKKLHNTLVIYRQDAI